jgi:phage terminase large subunit-like protein
MPKINARADVRVFTAVAFLQRCAEDRRVRWTNYKNILMWFDNWEHDLVELGFARVDAISKKVTILPEQL